MKMKEVKSVYLIGIGGIGMSAIARYFMQNGAVVSGYDKTQTPLTEKLVCEGAKVYFNEDVSRISTSVDLVVYTPAIPETHTELTFYKNLDIPVLKRAEVLGNIVNEGKCFAVAGSHGKSTTSALLAHVFKVSGKDCTGFLGAIASNYQSNFITGSAENFVVEADEFDRSFHHINPTSTIITSIDSDHLDIYGDLEGVQQAFSTYVENIRPGGKLFIHSDSRQALQSIPENIDVFTYGTTAHSDFRATNISITNGGYSFSVSGPTGEFQDHFIPMGGKYNVENALAVIAMATSYEISAESCKQALASFTGIKRRFDYVLKTENIVYIDDYAHHPFEIRSFVEAVREIYPNKTLAAIFQPHLYSRTKDYFNHFAQSLDLLDEVLIMDIYPAREKAIPGVSAALIAENMDKRPLLVNHTNLIEELVTVTADVYLTIGAGDIAKQVPKVKQHLIKKYSNITND